MSTPSKRQRTPYEDSENQRKLFYELFGHNEDEDEDDDGKEEKREQLPQLPQFPLQAADHRNWFCTDNALAKRVCMQRSLKDAANWATEFRSGLQGGMTAEECKRTCGYELPTSLLSSSSSYPSEMNTPTSGVPGVSRANAGIVNSLIASMLNPREIAPLISTSRSNLLANDSIQKERLTLDTELFALSISGDSPLYSNPTYHLNKILNLLRKQERAVHKTISYPLLVRYLPQIYRANEGDTFWPLFNQLPRFEKLQVLTNTFRSSGSILNLEEMQKLMEQGLFEFKDDEIFQNSKQTNGRNNSRNRWLWEMRDLIFYDFFINYWNAHPDISDNSTLPLFEKVIDQFLTLRYDEEMKTSGVILTDVLISLSDYLLRTVIVVDDIFGRISEQKMLLARKWLRIFLERGYYSGGSVGYRDSPIVGAILLQDPDLVAKVVKNLLSFPEEGLLAIAKSLKGLKGDIDDGDDEKVETLREKFIYNSLERIFQNLLAEIPLSDSTREKLFKEATINEVINEEDEEQEEEESEESENEEEEEDEEDEE